MTTIMLTIININITIGYCQCWDTYTCLMEGSLVQDEFALSASLGEC